jgi:hypothetical protein
MSMSAQGPPVAGTAEQQKLQRIEQRINRSLRALCRQGSVVAGWRTVDGRRLGPYWSLRYREAGRQRSVYLGRSAALAAAVRRRLHKLQQPRKQSLQLARLRAAVRASFRRHLAVWKQDLEAWGLKLHGLEIRGWRSFRPPIQEASPGFGQQNSISPDSDVGCGRCSERSAAIAARHFMRNGNVSEKKNLLRPASTGSAVDRSAIPGC